MKFQLSKLFTWKTWKYINFRVTLKKSCSFSFLLYLDTFKLNILYYFTKGINKFLR